MWKRLKNWGATKQYDSKQDRLGIRSKTAAAPAPVLGQLVPAGLLAGAVERLPVETQLWDEFLAALRRERLVFTGTTPGGPSDEGSDEA